MFAQHGEEVVLPFAVDHFKRDVGHVGPPALRVNASASDEDVEVWVVGGWPAGGLENCNRADVEFLAGAGAEDIEQTNLTGPHERGEKIGVPVKPNPEKIRHGEDDVAVGDARQQAPAYEVNPAVSVGLGAGEAERRFASESDAACFAARGATKLCKPHFIGIAATEHFLDDGVVIIGVEHGIDVLESIPVITEYLLEDIFVEMFHSRLPWATVII